MAHYFVSGTPENDCFQTIENGLVPFRLVSLYHKYAPDCFRWLENMRAGIAIVQDYRDRYGDGEILRRERKRRRKQRNLNDHRQYDLLASLEAIKPLRSRPEIIMFDSGAFTAWNSGETVELEFLEEAYMKAIGLVDGKSRVLLANLDVITDPDDTPLVKQAAMDKSDRNFERLNAIFPGTVIPIIHQGEPLSRIEQVARQAEGVGIIGISPNNDAHESARVEWTKNIMPQVSHLKVHGYATTGNDMLNIPGLWSADSASAGLHGKSYGQLDLCEPASGDPPADFNFIPKRYRGIPIGRELCQFDMMRREILAVRKDHLDLPESNDRCFVELSLRRHRHFPLAMLQYEMRARAIINAREIGHYAETRGQS